MLVCFEENNIVSGRTLSGHLILWVFHLFKMQNNMLVKNIVCWTLCYIYGILCIFQQRLMSSSSNGMSSPYKIRVVGKFVDSLPTRCLHNLPIYVSIFLTRLTCFSCHHYSKGYQNLKLSKWLYIPQIFALSLVIRRNSR